MIKTKNILISIIIPTRNRASFLKETIHSLTGQDFPPNNYEILIIDNGSTDATRAVALEAKRAFSHHQIRYVYEPVFGLLSGRHRGIKETRSELLTFVDDDIVADKYWLACIIESFQDSKVQLVTGRSLPFFKQRPPNWLDWLWSTSQWGLSCGYLSLIDFGESVKKIDPGYVWGLNFSIRKHTLLSLGGFHPDAYPKHLLAFRGDGETGLTDRAREERCIALYNPSALIHHQIHAQRLSLTYFRNRSYLQGISDAYTSIRKSEKEACALEIGSVDENMHQPLLFAEGEVVSSACLNREVLIERLRLDYERGYQRHLILVRRSPVLMNWVYKPDYWDYRLPNLKCRLAGENCERSYWSF